MHVSCQVMSEVPNSKAHISCIRTHDCTSTARLHCTVIPGHWSLIYAIDMMRHALLARACAETSAAACGMWYVAHEADFRQLQAQAVKQIVVTLHTLHHLLPFTIHQQTRRPRVSRSQAGVSPESNATVDLSI